MSASPMIYRRLGRTGLDASLLGLGSGGHNILGQRVGVPERDMHRLVQHALERGINLFDTAPAYLESEAILGRALTGVPRDRYILTTKVNVVADLDALALATPEQVIESVESSLRRLRTSEIDVLLVAGPLQASLYERFRADVYPVLEALRRQGKVRYLGSSEDSGRDGAHGWLARALEDDVFDVVMVAYNLINQSAERTVLPLCARKDVGALVVYAVRNVFSQPARLQAVIAELKRQGLVAPDAISDDTPLGWLTEERGESLISTAYRFAAGNEAVSTVMTSTINSAHVDQNIAAIHQPPLAKDDLARLRQIFGRVTVSIGN